MSLRVVATDLETGESQETAIPDGGYVLLTTAPCHLHYENVYPHSGTVQLTIKDYRQGSARPVARSWVLPTEPGPEGRTVRDRDGSLWRREDRGWRYAGSRVGSLFSWRALFDAYQPLTDATSEAVGHG